MTDKPTCPSCGLIMEARGPCRNHEFHDGLYRRINKPTVGLTDDAYRIAEDNLNEPALSCMQRAIDAIEAIVRKDAQEAIIKSQYLRNMIAEAEDDARKDERGQAAHRACPYKPGDLIPVNDPMREGEYWRGRQDAANAILRGEE